MNDVGAQYTFIDNCFEIMYMALSTYVCEVQNDNFHIFFFIFVMCIDLLAITVTRSIQGKYSNVSTQKQRNFVCRYPKLQYTHI